MFRAKLSATAKILLNYATPHRSPLPTLAPLSLSTRFNAGLRPTPKSRLFSTSYTNGLANPATREELLRQHCENETIKLSPLVDFKYLAHISPQFNISKLLAWISEASKIAAIERAQELAMKHFQEAYDLIAFGPVEPDNSSFEEKKDAAFHEGAHALVAHLLQIPVFRVFILRNSTWPGITRFMTTRDEQSRTKQDLLNNICVLLAPRAAENLEGLQKMGSSSDFKKAIAIANQMVTQEGMGSTIVGLDSAQEIELILQAQMRRAERLIKQNKAHLNRIAAALILYNDLRQDEFLNIMSGKKIEHCLRSPPSATNTATSRQAPSPAKNLTKPSAGLFSGNNAPPDDQANNPHNSPKPTPSR